MSSSSKIRVLVVDDSRVVRVAAVRMFGGEFEVISAVDGADGLSILERDSEISVVFTDLAMPEMDGFELLQAIREHTDANIRNLPVIVATGAGNPESAKQKAFSLGATDFVTKPFVATDIKARARSYAVLRQENRSLKENVTIDSLTGLLNVKGLNMQLEKEMSFAARHRSNLTLLTIEIDNYKDFFVRIGREGTEKVVRRVSGVLEETFRKEDSVARVGIARFIVTMPMALPENAVDLANRICHTIESFKAKLDGKRIKITVSIGVSSVYVDSKLTVNTLIGLANESLEQAAQKGSSQINELSLVEYEQQLQEEARRSMSIDNLLEQIQDNDPSVNSALLDVAVDRLTPLFKVLSDQQVHKIFFSRKKPAGKVLEFNSKQNQSTQQ